MHSQTLCADFKARRLDCLVGGGEGWGSERRGGGKGGENAILK